MDVSQTNSLSSRCVATGAALFIGVATIGYFFFKNMGSKSSKAKVTLENRQEKYTLPLVKREEISHDTRLFRFKLPSDDHVLGLPVGKHVNIITKIDGKLIIRSYTPVSSDESDKGYVDFIIKVYFPNVHPKFPDGGKMSFYMEKMKIGDTLDFRGPGGLLTYETAGKLLIQSKPTDTTPKIRSVQKIGLIAGGSGITPMLQIMRHIVRHLEEDNTEIYLLFANQTEADILCREEIEKVSWLSKGIVRVHYTVDKAPVGWRFSEGFINEDMLKDHMPEVGDDSMILICGPPPMVKFACMPNLKKLGWSEENIFVY